MFYDNRELYLIRHCETTGQESDAGLTEEGKNQAERLAHFLFGTDIKRLVSSPFARAVQSIEPYAKLSSLKIDTDPRLQERILSQDQLPNRLECLRETYNNLDLRFHGGETSREAMQRASAALEDILLLKQITAIVSHGNLSTLLLKTLDPTIGFSTWEKMTNPDVFRILFSQTGVTITRIWQPDK